MAGESDKTGTFREALKQLAALRRFSGPPAVFWQTYLDVMVSLAGARLGLIARKRLKEATGWRKVVASPANLEEEGLSSFFSRIENLCETAMDEGDALREIQPGDAVGYSDYGVAVALETGTPSEQWVGVFYLKSTSAESVDETLKRLLLANCLPADVQHYQKSNRAPGAAAQAASVIDLISMLDGKERFLEMAMAFVNELAGQHHCERVSLGWEKRGYVRLQAISHSDKFNRKMEVVSDLELAMEEAFDQDEEINWPPLDGEAVVMRDHEGFARKQGVDNLLSVPLRYNGEPVGVVMLEREGEPFLDDEIRLLRITADVAAPRLADLKRRDRWFGARWADGARGMLSKVIGPEKTWTKVLAVCGAIALGVLFFGGMTYRVEAPFLLRTENVAFLSAPYNGYIATVEGETGDVFREGQLLLTLDTRELLLEEAAAAADLSRYLREEEKARASGELAQMRILEAQAEQARVRLESVRFRLSQAEIRSPFAAYIVEGDLKKRLGAPVQQGDNLFRIARLDQLYVEGKVAERDIHEVQLGTSAEIAFTSQPKHKFPATVTLIEPVATTEEGENIFMVRCELAVPPEDWWRPGMGGLTKIDAGHRSFFWIIFHRTIDFFRMFFWL